MGRSVARWASTVLALLALALLAAACTSERDSGAPDAQNEDDEEEASGGTFSSGSSIGSGFVTAFGDFSEFDSLTTSVPGLTASHVASAVLPADRAVVVVEPGLRGALGGSLTGVSSDDRKAVLEGAAGLGLPADAVSFSGRTTYGGTRVQANMPVQSVPTLGPQLVDTVERVIGRSDASGVVFGLSDCGAPLSGVRRQAFQGAEASARELAESGGLRLGPLVALAQQTGAGPTGSFATADPCRPGESERPIATLQPLDAPPEVRVTLTVSGTWSVGNPPAASPPRSELSAVGRGSTTAKADEAYLVAILADEDGEGEVPSRRDQDRLVDALTRLGVSKDDIDIATGSDYGPVVVVQVEAKLSELERRGDQLERAVEDVLRRPDVTGVRFWHSDCTELLGKARTQAVADARARAGALADASAVRLGELVSVAEAGVYPGLDPCDDDAAALLALDDYAAGVQPLDANPEFTVETGVRLGFTLTP